MDPYTDSLVAGAAGMAVGLIVVVLIVIAVGVIDIIGMWHVFKKAGVPGWHALIPVYDTVTICKISGVNPWWSAAVVAPYVVNAFVPEGNAAMDIISTLVYLFGVGVSIYIFFRLAKSFGRGAGFTAGLVILRPIFMMILGFNKDAYLGVPRSNGSSDNSPSNPAPTNNPQLSAGSAPQSGNNSPSQSNGSTVQPSDNQVSQPNNAQPAQFTQSGDNNFTA